jgi:hypothetical protein
MKQRYYIKTPLDKGAMISICDESTDEVLAMAKTPELALVIKKAIENDSISHDKHEPETFTISEAELIRVTGYSRAQIGNLRHGNKQRGTEPELVDGQDFTAELHGKLTIVKYAEHTVEELRARHALSRVEKIKKPDNKNTGE